jgi:hypothetical protein
MSDETPSTEHVREAWAEMSGWDMSLDESDAAFDRWLESVRAEERERIAGNLARTAGGYYGMSGPTGDQKIWYDALSHAARIAREGA